MKIALDPYMHRHVPLLELPAFVADLGYEYIELSPRADFLDAGGTAETCEAAFWDSMDELLPVFESEGITLNLEPHPEDFVEALHPAVDMIRSLDSKNVRMLYCAPHTFHMGSDPATIIEASAPVLAHVHVADSFDHRASSGLRYIVNPPGSTARVHQHLNIGEGEVDWDAFFGTLAKVGFDGIMTACVFAWEEKAEESSRFMLAEMKRYVAKYWTEGAPGG